MNFSATEPEMNERRKCVSLKKAAEVSEFDSSQWNDSRLVNHETNLSRGIDLSRHVYRHLKTASERSPLTIEVVTITLQFSVI